MTRKELMKKILIAIGVVLIVIFIVNLRKNKNIINNEVYNGSKNLEISYDANTYEYVVYNLDTGEEVARAYDETELQIYTIDPDYDPKTYDFEDDVVLVDETFEE